ncbi:hypothetical protein M2271_008060, partial [Streptomyces sp. LBL]|uniref:hypothetical protein n=1 Tax=Streptomyces sp. LBL TaxID=2940562 RepID=UPI0024753462
GAEGHKAPLGIPGGIPRPGIRLAAKFSVVYAGPLARPLVLRVNLPGGKFWVVGWSLGFCILPGGKILVLVLLGRWRGPFLGLVLCGFVGALVRSGC